MARREAGILAAVLVLLPAVALSTPAMADTAPVTGMPTAGEAGLLEGTEQLLGPDGRVLEDRPISWVDRWSQQTVRLPTGEQRALPTLTRSLPIPDAGRHDIATMLSRALQDPTGGEQDGDGTDERPAQIRFHHTRMDAPPAMLGFDWLVQEREGRFVKVLRVQAMDPVGCGQHPLLAVLDATPKAARDRLAACLAEQPGLTRADVEVRVERDARPDVGSVWILTARIDASEADGVPERIRLVTAPQVAVPIERTITWRTEVDGDPRTLVRTVELTGWQAGDGALVEAEPLPTPPGVPLTSFTEQGPPGLDAELSYADALRAARSDARVAAYLGDHPDAGRTIVRLWDRHADERASPAATTGLPMKCRAHGMGAPDPEPAPSTEEVGWSFYWSGRGEDLIAYVDAPRTAGVVVEEARQVRTLEFAADGLGYPLKLPRPAPSMPAMREHLDAATQLAPQGDPFLAVMVPAGDEGQGPLYGLVGRAGCTVDPGTGNYTYEEGGLIFDDGEATGTYGFVVLANQYGALASTLGTPPPRAPGQEPGAGLNLVPIALAGLVVVAGTAATGAGQRLLAPLYSRFGSKEVIEHPLRAKLLDAIQAEPGATLPDLAQALNVNRDTLAYHARMLERHDHVVTTALSTGTVVHPTGHPAVPHADVLALKDADRVLASILDEPGQSVTALADALGIPKSRASELTSNLASSGLVDRVRDGRSLSLKPTPAGERVQGAGVLDA